MRLFLSVFGSLEGFLKTPFLRVFYIMRLSYEVTCGFALISENAKIINFANALVVRVLYSERMPIVLYRLTYVWFQPDLV